MIIESVSKKEDKILWHLKAEVNLAVGIRSLSAVLVDGYSKVDLATTRGAIVRYGPWPTSESKEVGRAILERFPGNQWEKELGFLFKAYFHTGMDDQGLVVKLDQALGLMRNHPLKCLKHINKDALSKIEMHYGDNIPSQITSILLMAWDMIALGKDAARPKMLMGSRKLVHRASKVETLHCILYLIPSKIEEYLREREYPLLAAHIEVLQDHPDPSVRRKAESIVALVKKSRLSREDISSPKIKAPANKVKM